MKAIIGFAFLLPLIVCLTNFRLSTNQQTILNIGDTLISTLGHFKATLLQTQCTLSIEQFEVDKYVRKGTYSSPDVSANCQYLEIREGKVVTDTGLQYMTVGTSFNDSTILTIDDNGVIRLIGTYKILSGRGQQSQQFKITNFETNQKLFAAYSQLKVEFTNDLGTITNNRKWQFSASFGQLNVFHFDNPGIGTSYSFARFNINNSQILDFNSVSFPGAIFPNITFTPRCVEPRIYLNFKPPYVFVADPYWPIFTLFEQGRYPVFRMMFGDKAGVYTGQTFRKLELRDEDSVCPEYTFEHQGGCITVCPAPFYHQMRGKYGYCVLTCEQFTPKNEITRVCSCVNPYENVTISSTNVLSCPQNSVAYPYGCFCNQTNQYFDRLYTFACVSECPATTYPLDGLCMNCPHNCLQCKQDPIYRRFLECTSCEAGYSLSAGQCIKECNNLLGNSVVNSICQQCTDPNCIQCVRSVGSCTRCGPLYSLQGTTCVQTCANSSRMVVAQPFSATCLALDSSCSVNTIASHYKSQPFIKCDVCAGGQVAHLDKCISSCPQNYSKNRQNYCVCANRSLLTINDQCLDQVACPITMSYDTLSESCLSCPFGCLTCSGTFCTSCSPGYFLYVAPQGIVCRRKSPLFPCDDQYSWSRNSCLVKEYANSALRLTFCKTKVVNCMVCGPSSQDSCIICNEGFYIYNNTCISDCPNTTIPYDNTCVLPQVQNCDSPYVGYHHTSFVETFAKFEKSQSYQYYTFGGKQPSNDPVGYIPYFQQLTQRKNDGQFRDSDLISPKWTCLKCSSTFGLSDDFSQCLPCPSPCQDCYMAKSTSCITSGGSTTNTCPYKVDGTNTCVQSCDFKTQIPVSRQGQLFCVKSQGEEFLKVDSAVYKLEGGQERVFFVFSEQVKNNANLTIKVDQATNLKLKSTGVSAPTTGSVQDGTFVQINNNNAQDDSTYILDLSQQLSSLSAGDKYFPFPVYGASAQQSHPQFMKTWLAYIGYFMGITVIILHCLYIGNDLLYKVDNTLILAQTIYYFSFVKLLVGKLLSQFYYGWFFAHFGFFPNFFLDTIPGSYVQLQAPNSYKIATMDANNIRNSGNSISLLIVFIGAFALVTAVVYLIYKLGRKQQIWYPNIARSSLIAGLQFLSMNIFYWSVAHLMYDGGFTRNDDNLDFAARSDVVSVFFIAVICIYTVGRWVWNPVGGLYMAKRVLIATILAAAYEDLDFIAPLLLLELVFMIIRFIMESPQKGSHKLMILVESGLHMLVYLLLFLVTDAGVNSVIISIVIFVMIVVLASDLSDVYLESQEEWIVDEDQGEGSNQSIVKAKAYKRKSKIYERDD